MNFSSIAALIVCIIAASAPEPASSTTKTWKFPNDIMDPVNWKGGKASPHSRAVVFPRELNALVSLDQLYAEELVLPENGEIEIRQGGFVQVAPNASAVGFEILPLKLRRWLDPENWKLQEENAATPDAERIPCAYDDVVFPGGGTVSVILPEMDLSIRSLHLDGLSLTDSMWTAFLDTDYGNEQFFISDRGPSKVSISERSYPQSGLLCQLQDTAAVRDWVCLSSDKKKSEPPCFEPVDVIGNCGKTCAGVVVMDVGPNFNMADLAHVLPEEDGIDFYMSKVVNDGGKTFIQAVFADKGGEYKELSPHAAKKLHDIISEDPSKFNVKSSILKRSGMALPKGSPGRVAFAILFGTLFAVTVIFGALYMRFEGPLEAYNIRVPFLEVLSGTFGPRLFSNMDHDSDDRTRLTEAEETDRSFDNPMFGSSTVMETSGGAEATSSGETGAGVVLEEIVTSSEEPAKETAKRQEKQPSEASSQQPHQSEHVNPLYEESEKMEELILIEDLDEDEE